MVRQRQVPHPLDSSPVALGWRGFSLNQTRAPLPGHKLPPKKPQGCNYIFSQRINVGVAIRYRPPLGKREIWNSKKKLRTVKRNRGPNVCLPGARFSWRVQNVATPLGGPWSATEGPH